MTARVPARRVVFLTITFHPEPGALRGLPLAKRLRDDHGWDVEVVTAIPWYPFGRFYAGYRSAPCQVEMVDGITVHRLWLSPSHDRSAVRRILTYASFMVSVMCVAPFSVGRAPLIYHVDNLPTTGLAAAWLSLWWRARIVQHIGDLWPESVTSSGMLGSGRLRRVVNGVLHPLMRFVYATDAAITVITEGFRHVLMERGVSGEKVHVLPNWADEDRLRPVLASVTLRAEIVPPGAFAVLYAGNMGPMQALTVVLDAAEVLRDDPTICFVLIGDGPDRPALERAVRERRLGNVRLLPSRPVEQMPALNAIADALLIHLKDEPFLDETVPSKTQVSLLAGRPIVMGCRGEAARIVRESGAGLVFTPERGDELAAAVQRLARMRDDERALMATRGTHYYWEHLSLEAGARRMNDLFERVLQLPPAR